MKEKLLVIFIIAISAIPPLTTDMYLPSLPNVATEFGVSDSDANITLIAFFIAFGLSTLVWGTLSDKYGRRPMLIIGFILYFAGSLLCAVSGSVVAMSASRILQGVGSGSGMAVSGAIVRDKFSGRKQEGILAAIQSMVMIGPVVGPVLGSFIIEFSGWRGVFFLQTIIGAIIIVASVIFKETIKNKNEVGIKGALARLALLMSHGRFAVMVVLFALPGACIMAYVSASTYIYQDHFALSNYQYSMFFGICSAAAITGPAIYMAASARWSRFSVVLFCFAALAAVGVVAFTVGEWSPFSFAAPMFALSLLASMTRPAGAFLILNYHERDSGSASALMNSAASFTGSIGMAVVTVHPRYILVIGAVAFTVGVASVVTWLALSRRYDVG
ncbi:MAG: MFS transporter [Clostridiales Family XIII bacterium]|jgi:DHA1 family bicyclomycin/chloramphenicol resistance-like MFS transporter|nr:MFS transporter [Clostridiales Family XIII bacterium]